MGLLCITEGNCIKKSLDGNGIFFSYLLCFVYSGNQGNGISRLFYMRHLLSEIEFASHSDLLFLFHADVLSSKKLMNEYSLKLF